jgi:hypothetical protein
MVAQPAPGTACALAQALFPRHAQACPLSRELEPIPKAPNARIALGPDNFVAKLSGQAGQGENFEVKFSGGRHGPHNFALKLASPANFGLKFEGGESFGVDPAPSILRPWHRPLVDASRAGHRNNFSDPSNYAGGIGRFALTTSLTTSGGGV